MRMSRSPMLSAMLILAVSATAAAQGLTEARIQQALDKDIEFLAEDLPIEGVFNALGEKADLQFVVHADTLDHLPYGSQTRLDVEFRNVRLRDALTELLDSQALDWQIRQGQIYILPSPSLYRMNRRPSFDELSLLSKLHTTRLEPSSKGTAPMDQLRKATGVDSLAIAWHIQADRKDVLRRAEFKLPGPANEWLNMVCHGNDATWYLAGDTIVVLPRAEQARRQMQTRTSVQIRGQKLVHVLRDLADKARLELRLEPGVLTLLPDATRESVNLAMQDVSIAQALEVISGATGLVFEPVSGGIAVQASDYLKSRPVDSDPQPRRKRPRFFLKVAMQTDRGNAEIFFPADELPDDLVEKVLKRRQELIEQLDEELSAD